ncbi:hypothetical protein G6F70_008381 [Rhizopus microsporus]|uniref:Uncharacterized protein n=2 Tax=Rhizopus TaxID=4842 RepID=A0A367IUV2_RHIAZ|nr:hypothetical protein G6F71_004872 [Rhizopus microsporus]RCH81470.1 hypothetical protein CU097_004019 [Rhizopus azygosporus]KAG1195248.1 hypothetical protein G6F70_008381 [Rhizopus microsporus]KAG1212053.1 hypothetical protein G6F69_004055 [Rhizopus microsporus]KAG1229075.1 hypothetical protein G6F67_007405 [Rhizopus microsporus]
MPAKKDYIQLPASPTISANEPNDAFSSAAPFENAVSELPPYRSLTTEPQPAVGTSSSKNSDHVYIDPNVGDAEDTSCNLQTGSEQADHAIVMIPGDHQLEYEEYNPPPGYSVHMAEYRVTSKGKVRTRDRHVNEDPEALLQFLYQHNTPPTLIIRFKGFCEETRWVTKTRRNYQGEEETDHVSETQRVDGFDFKIDTSQYVSSTSQGIYVLPNNNETTPRVRQLCNDYVRSKNVLKELKLTKEINWDFQKLAEALKNAIRSTGEFEGIEITFKTEKEEIIVKPNNWVSCIVDNIVFKILMFITCFWVFAVPFTFFYGKKFGHSNLRSGWNMTISEKAWYQQHAREIVAMCRNRIINRNQITKLTPIPPFPDMPGSSHPSDFIYEPSQ